MHLTEVIRSTAIIVTSPTVRLPSIDLGRTKHSCVGKHRHVASVHHDNPDTGLFIGKDFDIQKTETNYFYVESHVSIAHFQVLLNNGFSGERKH